MILQTYHKFNTKINKYGCYFLSLVYLASQKAKVTFDVDDIKLFYERFVDEDLMTDTCYVKQPGKMLREMGLNVDYDGKCEAHVPACRGQYEILCFRRSYINNGKAVSYKHFVVGDGFGHVAYDPMGVSNAVKHGHLESKRIFLRRG